MKSKWLPVSWKRNIRKIPPGIVAKVSSLSTETVTATSVKRILLSDIASDKYHHIGITLQDGKPTFTGTILPRDTIGRYSHANIHGKEIVRRDKPKVTKTYSWESPNFGGWQAGSHTCSFDREVYEREFIGPKELELCIELLERGEERSGQAFAVFKFCVNEVLDSTAPTFEKKLLFNLNILQENTGSVDVFDSEATQEEYLKTIYVDWEIIPVGEREDPLERIFARIKPTSIEERELLKERYAFLSKLRPVAYIAGTNGFRRYFGAKFKDDLVVFENMEYGNAIYVMFEEWETLSRQSRFEIRTGDSTKFLRIIHSVGWEDRLSQTIRERRKAS